ncbi:MAG: hypothetical protein KGI75_27370, partial [Rhizobiaceae bacterium]|nr:hypothetical protein [Rhizobiaceae bacterium]
SGQENLQMRFGSEKYAKFAYSARYGFSVESDERAFASGAFDSILAFSDDGLHYRVRETNEEAKLAGDTLYAKWSPYPDVKVETWLVPGAPWHIRVHKISTPRPLQTAEGGFAIERRDFEADTLVSEEGSSHVVGAKDFSGILDLGSSVPRQGVAQKAPPNTNLIVAKTLIPQLRTTIPAGETTLVCAVLAENDPATVSGPWTKPPKKPDIDALRHLIETKGVTVSAIEAPGRMA